MYPLLPRGTCPVVDGSDPCFPEYSTPYSRILHSFGAISSLFTLHKANSSVASKYLVIGRH
jgi:hypothetical protein